MEYDPWTRRLLAASRRYQSALQSRSDLHLGFEEIDVDDDSRADFPYPFCAEDFDIIGLCCHIDDEHPVEAKNGVCPVCRVRVGTNMVGHITMQHQQFFKFCLWNTDTWEMRKSVTIQLPNGKEAVGETRVQFNFDQIRLLVSNETQIAVYDASKMEFVKQVSFQHL